MIMATERLADLLGLTTRRVNQLATEGIAIRTAPGQFDGPQSVRNYFAMLRERAEQAGTKLDLNNERAKLAKAQRIGFEMRNAATRASHLPADQVAAEWAGIVAKVEARILDVPERLHSRLFGLTLDQAELIADELREALSGLHADNNSTPAGRM